MKGVSECFCQEQRCEIPTPIDEEAKKVLQTIDTSDK